jgi:hypothetical protein
MKTAIVVAAFSIKNQTFDSRYLTCLKTWEFWCKKNGIDFIPLVGEKENIVDVLFSKWTDLELFVNLEKYDYITMVDFDTIVRWDCPNFMELFHKEQITVTMVLDQGGRAVSAWHYNQWLSFDPTLYTYANNYFNSGFISAQPGVFRTLVQEMGQYRDYYLSNKDKSYHPVGIGISGGIRLDAPDQTPVNLIIHKHFGNQISISPNILNYMVAHHIANLNNDVSYIQDALIIHYGSANVCETNVVDNFWSHFGQYYSN